jgi:hypothetical protein
VGNHLVSLSDFRKFESDATSFRAPRSSEREKRRAWDIDSGLAIFRAALELRM